MGCHVIPASGNIDVNILELSVSPCSGASICSTSMELHGEAYGEGIRPETDTGNDWEEKN